MKSEIVTKNLLRPINCENNVYVDLQIPDEYVPFFNSQTVGIFFGQKSKISSQVSKGSIIKKARMLADF